MTVSGNEIQKVWYSLGAPSVPIIALETIGSDCFYRSITMNENGFNKDAKVLPLGVGLVHDAKYNLNIAHFNGFSSKASGSLGASQPSAAVLRMALDRPGGVFSYSIPDELSMEALARFAGERSLLTERMMQHS